VYTKAGLLAPGGDLPRALGAGKKDAD
jgi:hypothetical protein